MKTISTVGLKLIKSFEGCYLTTYDDLQPKVKLTPSTKIIGTLTIGWGHTGNDVKIGQTITQEQADKMLLYDMTKYVNYVNNSKNVPFVEMLNQNQFDALVSFCYNAGQGNLKKLCEFRTIQEIPDAMLMYINSKGKFLQGLLRRREAERELFLKAPSQPTYPVNQVPTVLKDQMTLLENKVNLLIKDVGEHAEKLMEIPPPDWFVKEFPHALDVMNQKTGTRDFWRAIAITFRYLQK